MTSQHAHLCTSPYQPHATFFGVVAHTEDCFCCVLQLFIAGIIVICLDEVCLEFSDFTVAPSSVAHSEHTSNTSWCFHSKKRNIMSSCLAWNVP